MCFVEIWSHVLICVSLSFDLQVHFKVTLHLKVTLNFRTCICAAAKTWSQTQSLNQLMLHIQIKLTVVY